MKRLEVDLKHFRLKNPLMPASGCFAFGHEMNAMYDLSVLGALVTKSVTYQERIGNQGLRLAECSHGLLNSIGLQNPGLKVFVEENESLYQSLSIPKIVNVAGASEEEYLKVIEDLEDVSWVDAYELNVSCPNVDAGGMAMGQDEKALESLVRKSRKKTQRPLWVKLSPQVKSIASVARIAEKAGADALVVCNTFKGLRMDLYTGKPVIPRAVAGYSGPAIKPQALAMVYETAQAVSIPVIGVGGIQTAEDVLEMFLAGASAVQIGTANLLDPYCMPKILKELPKVLEHYGYESLSEIQRKVRRK